MLTRIWLPQLGLLAVLSHCVFAQELPITRRLSVLTQKFLDSAEIRDIPAKVPGDRSQVTVLFRLNEQGSVLDLRAAGGSNKARDSATAAVHSWRFKPTLIRGKPVQIQTGVVLDYATDPVSIRSPTPMSADQISPVLSTRCSLAILSNAPDAIMVCKKEAQKVTSSSLRTPMEELSARYELGVALQQSGHWREALLEFNEAIGLLSKGLTATNGEWGQMYWHRALVKQQLGLVQETLLDLDVAARCLARAADVTGITTYRDMFAQISETKAKLARRE